MSDEDFQEPKIGLEEALSAIAEMVENAKAMPLSASVLIQRDEILYLVDAALDAIPIEIRQAQLMLREHRELAERASFEADEIIAAATAKAERLVSRAEIVRQANQNAARMIQNAKEEAAQLRYSAEDFIDQKLAAFEIALESISKSVKGGREKLALSVSSALEPETQFDGEMESKSDSNFFDQDDK